MALLLAVEINVPQSLANVLTSQGAALPQPVTGSALVDTGATSCCVEESLVQGLGLQPVGQVNVCGQSGVKLQNAKHGIRWRRWVCGPKPNCSRFLVHFGGRSAILVPNPSTARDANPFPDFDFGTVMFTILVVAWPAESVAPTKIV